MSTGLTQQLAGYGDVFAAEVDALAGETIMKTDQEIIQIDRAKNDKKNSSWRRVGALVGAAAVIIASVVGVTVFRSDGEVIAPPDVATPPFATIEDAAYARDNAVVVGDWEAFRAAFADQGIDVIHTGREPFSRNEELAEGRFAYNVALGARPLFDSCTVSSGDSAICTMAYSDDVLKALGIGPVVELHEFRISDGLLVFRGPEIDAVTPPVLEAFRDWLDETQHPAIAARRAYSQFPVIEDAPVVAAAMVKAANEFLAQYNG